MRPLVLVLLALLAFACERPREQPKKREPLIMRSVLLSMGRADFGPFSPRATEHQLAPQGGERVHAKARFVWIRRRPTPESEWDGYITLGQSLRIRSDVPSEQGTGTVCERWIPVEPSGWVCIGRDATLVAEDPVAVALREDAADTSSPWPFDYARSLETPRYRKVPTMQEQRATEGDVPTLVKKIDKARDAKSKEELKAIDARLVEATLDLATERAPELFAPPYTILESDERLKFGSTIAFTRTFLHDDRSWLLSWDRAVIPMARTKVYPRSAFHGTVLEEGITLPLAFSKKHPAKRYRLDHNGVGTDVLRDIPPHTLIQLGREASRGEYVHTADDWWVKRSEVAVIEPTAKLPKRLPASGRRTWVEVSTVGGWLVAFEGEKPVYATLISAGKGEVLPDGSMRATSSTPIGTYSVASKFRTATMRSDRRPDMVHAEVMYTQVFFGDYALHGAYWHDEWGDRRSAGCVNLAPIDSKWLFDWSEPRMPEDWHAKRVLGGDPSTVVVGHP